MYDQTGLTQFKINPLAAGSFGGPSGENPEGGMGWLGQWDGRSGEQRCFKEFQATTIYQMGEKLLQYFNNCLVLLEFIR